MEIGLLVVRGIPVRALVQGPASSVSLPRNGDRDLCLVRQLVAIGVQHDAPWVRYAQQLRGEVARRRPGHEVVIHPRSGKVAVGGEAAGDNIVFVAFADGPAEAHPHGLIRVDEPAAVPQAAHTGGAVVGHTAVQGADQVVGPGGTRAGGDVAGRHRRQAHVIKVIFHALRLRGAEAQLVVRRQQHRGVLGHVAPVRVGHAAGQTGGQADVVQPRLGRALIVRAQRARRERRGDRGRLGKALRESELMGIGALDGDVLGRAFGHGLLAAFCSDPQFSRLILRAGELHFFRLIPIFWRGCRRRFHIDRRARRRVYC